MSNFIFAKWASVGRGVLGRERSRRMGWLTFLASLVITVLFGKEGVVARSTKLVPLSNLGGVLFPVFVATFPLTGVLNPSYAEDVAFNVTSTLTWNDYKRVTHEYETLVVGSGWPSCASKGKTEHYGVNIPYRQNVELIPSHRSDPPNQCKRDDPKDYVAYRDESGNWIGIDTNQTLDYEGELQFSLSPKSGSGWGDGCASYCWATVKATFLGEVPTTKQQKTYGPYAELIPVIRSPQELERVPLPKTQFTFEYMQKERDSLCAEWSAAVPEIVSSLSTCPLKEISQDIQYGAVRDFICESITDKPDELKIWCQQQEDELVISGYTLKAQDGPLAPFTSIGLVKSSGKKDGIVKVVKWKDDEFQKGHDLIEFIGYAVDIDGQVVEYRWESNKDGVISNKSSFFYTDLSLGLHTISFKAKDNDGLWSEPVTRQVEVVKPPLLLVHGYRGDQWMWTEDTKDFLDSYYPIETVTLGPRDHTSVSQGAQALSTKIKELTTKYGVSKINLLTYSWGGLVSRQYIQKLGYGNNVNKLVMMGAPNHGSSMATLLWNSLREPNQMGVHYLIPALSFVAVATVLTPGLTASGAVMGNFKDLFGGEYSYELIPGSSTLRSLNGNKKDEGYVGNEPNDNIGTAYGNNVQYFNVNVRDIPGLSHWHLGIPFTSLQVYELLIPTISIMTDFIVSTRSANLDNVPQHVTLGIWDLSKFDIVWHGNLGERKEMLKSALYYLGDDPPEASTDTGQPIDVSKALAANVIYAPANGELSPLAPRDTVRQEFEVDSTTKNLTVVLNASLAEGAERPFTFRLVSPSGTIIDEDTQLDNVAYLNSNPLFYAIANAEPGTWTAIIKSKTNETVNYALGVIGETNFWVGMGEGTHVKPGEPFTITAYAQQEGTAVSGLQVKAMILKNIDEGERIGSKYGSQRRDLAPVEVALNDLGDGRYEVNYKETLESGVYRVFITATDPATQATREVFSTFFVEHEYDLAVQSADIHFSNETPAHHETVTISAIVHNATTIDAQAVEVWFTDGSLGKEGTVIGKTTVDIAAGGNATASVEWQALAGQREIFAIVSPMDTFLEQNLTNNTASKLIQVVDNPPVANAGPDQISRFNNKKQQHNNIFLDGTGSTDEFAIERYEWDFNTSVDSSNDGIPDNDVDFIGPLQTIPAGTYPGVGQYTVKLTVFDRSQQTTSDTMTITVQDEYDIELPIAVIGETQILEAGKSIRFDGSGSSDNFGIAAYLWDIDTTIDSNSDGISDNDVDLVGMNPILEVEDTSKVYSNVKLTVMDTAGHRVSKIMGESDEVDVATFSLSGYLFDKYGNPLENVIITVDGRTVVTDDKGYYQIEGLKAGTYTVTASKDGLYFRSVIVTVNADNPEVKLPDLIAVDLFPARIVIAKETGQNEIVVKETMGELITQFTTGTAGNDINVTVADFDSDGEDEIAVNVGKQVTLYKMDGSIFRTFAIQQEGDIASGDTNGDGLPELLTTVKSANTNAVDVYSFEGQPLKTISIDSLGKNTELSIAAADVNGDGLVEIIAGDLKGDQVAIYAVDSTEISTFAVFQDTASGTREANKGGNGNQNPASPGNSDQANNGNGNNATQPAGNANSDKTNNGNKDNASDQANNGNGNKDEQPTTGNSDKASNGNNDAKAEDDSDNGNKPDTEDKGNASKDEDTNKGKTAGVRVAAGDTDGDGTIEVIVGMADEGSLIQIYSVDGSLKAEFDPFVGKGVELATGDTNRDGTHEIIVGDADGTEVVLYQQDGTEIARFQGLDQKNIASLALGKGRIEALDLPPLKIPPVVVEGTSTPPTGEQQSGGNDTSVTETMPPTPVVTPPAVTPAVIPDKPADTSATDTTVVTTPVVTAPVATPAVTPDKPADTSVTDATVVTPPAATLVDTAPAATPVVTPRPAVNSEATPVPPTPCPTDGDLMIACDAGWQIIKAAEVLPSGYVTNGVLDSTLRNRGWVSNLVITPNGQLIGGTVTGYIDNQGIMRDFEFRGMSIIGGSLAGNIRNISRVRGFFQDVTLLAGTKITGGILTGTIKGDETSPALLEHLRIESGAHLSGVQLGAGVKLEPGVVIEN